MDRVMKVCVFAKNSVLGSVLIMKTPLRTFEQQMIFCFAHRLGEVWRWNNACKEQKVKGVWGNQLGLSRAK